MASTPTPIDAVIDSVNRLGATRSGRTSFTRWKTLEPHLADWSSAGDLASACRAARPADQDPTLTCLLRLFPSDPLVQITLVAAISRGLGSIVSVWARAGVDPTELAELEADLITGCWAAAASLADRLEQGEQSPTRLGLHLLDQARQSVRNPRRRHRRTLGRQDPLDIDPASTPMGPAACETLAREVAGAVRSGRISLTEAKPVFLTRVAGFDVAETADRLGWTPGAVRAARARAERRLAGTAA